MSPESTRDNAVGTRLLRPLDAPLKRDYIEFILEAEEKGRGEYKPLSWRVNSSLFKRRCYGLHFQKVAATLGVLLFVGTNTTSATLCVTLLYLVKYPDVQERLYAEVTDVCAGGITVDSIDQLNYAEACAKEGLRMQPRGTGM